MKLNNITNFIALTPLCEFCGEALCTRLIGKSVPNHVPAYQMDFDVIEFYDEAQRLAAQLVRRLKGDFQVSYSSDITGNSVNYYYQIGETKKLILSIDLDTNVVSGNTVDHLQNILWDHKLVLVRYCGKCKNDKEGYVCESTPLYLERKKCAIMPFSLETEIYNVNINDKTFSLMSSPGLKGTFLVTDGDLVKELTYVPLHHLRGADVIINKIKTILVFS